MRLTQYDDLIWASVNDMLFCTKEEFLATLDESTVWPLIKDGVLLALRISDGPELHIVTTKTRQFTMGDVREMLRPLIEKYSYATTCISRRDKRQQRFVERIGFRRIKEDDYDVIYFIDKLP
jgi:hypothetical protein